MILKNNLTQNTAFSQSLAIILYSNATTDSTKIADINSVLNNSIGCTTMNSHFTQLNDEDLDRFYNVNAL